MVALGTWEAGMAWWWGPVEMSQRTYTSWLGPRQVQGSRNGDGACLGVGTGQENAIPGRRRGTVTLSAGQIMQHGGWSSRVVMSVCIHKLD